MDPLTRLRVDEWRVALERCADSLAVHAGGIDRLDVVGDGNTGAHLAAAIRGVVESVHDAAPRDFAELAGAMRLGSEPSPPSIGRSGELLCAFFAGVADAIVNTDAIDGARLAVALEAGADTMAQHASVLFETVADASIVGVAQRSAAAAISSLDRGADLAAVVLAAAEAGLDALEATPSESADLAQAGVVDAGAAGFVVFLEAVVGVVHGEDPDDLDRGDDDGLEWCRYAVAMHLEATDIAVDRLSIVWKALGEDVAIEPAAARLPAAGGDGPVPARWSARVFTDDLGAVIEAAIDAGRPSRIAVTDRSRPGAPRPRGG